MARLESRAVAGFYATPVAQLPRIAGLLALQPEGPREPGVYRSPSVASALDPCAGEGEAVCEILGILEERLEGDRRPTVEVYTCEMEASRHAALTKRLASSWKNKDRALRGDAFRVTFSGDGVGFLYLNAPYDDDPEHARLEQKFLARFTRALAPRGVLAYVVPHAALAASADHVARYFTDVRCFRFAGDDFDAYKQVVLFARRSHAVVREEGPYGRVTEATEFVDLAQPDPAIREKVLAWSRLEGVRELPKAGDRKPLYEIPTHTGEALREWRMRAVDVAALVERCAPWKETRRGGELASVGRVLPELPVADLMHRTYEVAMPPRPAHVAAGLAAGLFNGRRIDPDDARSGLPPLLVKGVFDREWRTVEEKHNKDGDKTGEVQVQQPKLQVTVLDLAARKYASLAPKVEATGATDVSGMSVGDLIAGYSRSLSEVMERQCRVLYHPGRDADSVELPELGRRLFTAQAHAARASVKMLRGNSCKMPILLGEIGAGKTTTALAVAATVRARRTLVLCPPHLLDTWRAEVASTLPAAEFRVLASVSDVDALAADETARPVVAVMSREAAKLGHGVESAGADCPRCGLPTPAKVDLAKRRATCERRTVRPADDYARLARELALHVRPHAHGPYAPLRGRLDERYRHREKLPRWRGLSTDLATRIRERLVRDFETNKSHETVKRALARCLHAAPDDAVLVALVPSAHGDSYWQNFAEELPLLLATREEGLESARRALSSLKDRYSAPYSSGLEATPLKRFDAKAEKVVKGERGRVAGLDVTVERGRVVLDGVVAGSVEAARRLLDALVDLGKWTQSPVCGERLYQAVPEPRRYPLSRYVARYHKKLFDFLVLDEAHEYGTSADSAQSIAAHRLTALRIPTVAMTGSIMNGYAESLFPNMWALSPEFRDEFDRSERGAFVDRYGYRKRLVQDRRDGEVVAFGSQSDRIERAAKDVGDAPGILPLFLFRHLLRSAVTIHKADLAIELPRCSQSRAGVEASGKHLAEYKRMLSALLRQIAADRFVKDLAGKLFGALAELPSYLDRATEDVGNGGSGVYEVRYPASCGGGLVTSAGLLPAKGVLPKEWWLLDKVEEELRADRNVMVFGWHLGLLPRLARLIRDRVGEEVPILWADKVPTGKRQAWIDREIVKKKRRVMVANPVAIQTGLNNLVHFATEIWCENPACNPVTYRQAIGRIDRIGQRSETRVLFGYYEGTLQEQMHELLLAKVAISIAVDGLDPESALRASGVEEDPLLTGMSIGKQLWSMIEGDFTGKKRRAA